MSTTRALSPLEGGGGGDVVATVAVVADGGATGAVVVDGGAAWVLSAMLTIEWLVVSVGDTSCVSAGLATMVTP